MPSEPHFERSVVRMLALLLLKMFNKYIHSFQRLLNGVKIPLHSACDLFQRLEENVDLAYSGHQFVGGFKDRGGVVGPGL